MRILFVSPRLCLPCQTGARLREYHLARALAERAEVTYASFVPAGMEPPRPADLPFFHEVLLAPLRGRNSPGKILQGLTGRWPLPILNYFNQEMRTVLAGIAARKRFDLVHLDSFVLAAYAPFLESQWGGAVEVVYDWHNIGSELTARLSAGMPAARKAYARLAARRLESVERWMLRSGLGHAVCSERERGQLLALVPEARVEVIENGVDTEYFVPDEVKAPRRRVVFVGSMDYAPNSEAVLAFARGAWPRIRERFVDWRLTIVGSNPGPAVLELQNGPGIEVTGTVPDVRPFYQDAVAAVVPLRSGGGTRLKILEAMAAGVPVVSTTLGAEGLEISPGRNILIADDDEAWLPALMSLQCGSRWSAQAAAGLQLVRSRHDWRMLGERLFESYTRWLAEARASK